MENITVCPSRSRTVKFPKVSAEYPPSAFESYDYYNQESEADESTEIQDGPELPSNPEDYAEEMRCLICHFIPIPPISMCQDGHIYCKHCGDIKKKCTRRNELGHRCHGLITETRSEVYETIFVLSTFSCPYKHLGCQDIFTGRQICDMDIFQNCPFSKIQKHGDPSNLKSVTITEKQEVPIIPSITPKAEIKSEETSGSGFIPLVNLELRDSKNETVPTILSTEPEVQMNADEDEASFIKWWDI